MADVIDMSGKPRSATRDVAAPDVVEMIKELLTQAKAGNVLQVALVWQTAAGVILDGYSPGAPHQQVIPIIGGLERCKATLINGMITERAFE